MSDIQRYNCPQGCAMFDNDNGQWVLYEDYERLDQEFEIDHKQLEAVITLKGKTEEIQRQKIEELDEECEVASRSIRNYSEEVQDLKQKISELEFALQKENESICDLGRDNEKLCQQKSFLISCIKSGEKLENNWEKNNGMV